MTTASISTDGQSPTAALLAFVEGTTVALQANPAAGVIRPQAETRLVPGTATQVSVRASGHEFTIDEPAALGGSNAGANPVEHLLASLGTCQVITYQLWATKLGMRLDSIEVNLSGELDLRGFLGVDPDVRAGFQSIDLDVRLHGPESREVYAALTKAVDEHCPVLDVLTNSVSVCATHAYNEG